MTDPCDSIFNEWVKAADELEALRTELKNHNLFRTPEKGLFDEPTVRAEFEAAEKKANELHAELGKCLKANGMMD